MKDMFDKAVHEELTERINRITSDAVPQWGKMNAGQMLAHLNLAFKTSMANQPAKRSMAGILFGKMSKRSFTGNKPFKQGLPTDRSLVVTEQRDFNRERDNLLRQLRIFCEGGPTVISKHKHPFFGKMTVEEWKQLMYKHTDHHLRQFGV